jgi:hypothetical protein
MNSITLIQEPDGNLGKVFSMQGSRKPGSHARTNAGFVRDSRRAGALQTRYSRFTVPRQAVCRNLFADRKKCFGSGARCGTTGLEVHAMKQNDALQFQEVPFPMPKDKPVHEVRLGAIKAAIWKNDTQNGVRYNATFSRLYRDEEEWKNTDSFGRDDLLVLGKVADQAHSWIHAQSQEDREENGKRTR